MEKTTNQDNKQTSTNSVTKAIRQVNGFWAESPSARDRYA